MVAQGPGSGGRLEGRTCLRGRSFLCVRADVLVVPPAQGERPGAVKAAVQPLARVALDVVPQELERGEGLPAHQALVLVRRPAALLPRGRVLHQVLAEALGPVEGGVAVPTDEGLRAAVDELVAFQVGFLDEVFPTVQTVVWPQFLVVVAVDMAPEVGHVGELLPAVVADEVHLPRVVLLVDLERHFAPVVLPTLVAVERPRTRVTEDVSV